MLMKMLIKTCRTCKIWFNLDFETDCPVYRAQLNDLNNKISALKKKKEDKAKKSIKTKIITKGISINNEACSKYEEN